MKKKIQQTKNLNNLKTNLTRQLANSYSKNLVGKRIKFSVTWITRYTNNKKYVKKEILDLFPDMKFVSFSQNSFEKQQIGKILYLYMDIAIDNEPILLIGLKVNGIEYHQLLLSNKFTTFNYEVCESLSDDINDLLKTIEKYETN